jgi:3-deoxy-D-manno-octulosonate 8-phosphate phosphatase KdsC-like HAD superfamily phosphatase
MSMDIYDAKECALFVVKEIKEELKEFDTMDGYSIDRIDFWNKVENEIINL